MTFNFNSGYGQIVGAQLAASVGPNMGRIMIVVEDSDPQVLQTMMQQLVVPDPMGKVRFYSTLAAAYDACTSNANDVILLSAHTTHALSTGIEWSKNRIHVIGMDGGDRLVQQGAKIELSGAVDSAYVLKVTGVRNSFRNLKIIQSSTHANALNVVQFAGEGNLWKNCSFLFGVADNLDLTTSSEALMGEDSGTFINCSFGTDVLVTSAARNVMAIDAITGASSADGMKSCRFVDCEWVVLSSEANAVLVKVIDTAAAKFLNVFIRPRFHAVVSTGAGGVAITNAFQSVASFADGVMHLINPCSMDCTNLCNTLTANVKTYGPVTSAQAGEGGTPS